MNEFKDLISKLAGFYTTNINDLQGYSKLK
jgi:hypothetical protein